MATVGTGQGEDVVHCFVEFDCSNWLLRNDGAGSFIEEAQNPTMVNLVVGDFNGDGVRNDIFGNPADFSGPDGRLLLLNDGTGTFTQVTVPGDSGPGVAGDFHGDGGGDDIYLYGTVDELLRNDGSGTFTSVTTGIAVARAAQPSGAVAGDFRGDGGADDIFICNRGAANELLLNDGTGTFTKVTTGDAVLRTDDSSSVVAGDFAGDGGALDIYVCNGAENVANELLLNDGAGIFSSVTTSTAVSTAKSLGAVVGDFSGYGAGLLDDLYVLNDGKNELFLTRRCIEDGFSESGSACCASPLLLGICVSTQL
eukprot:COSAG02_NODE_5758_length_4062_cov_1.950038_2_plen_311_part_00